MEAMRAAANFELKGKPQACEPYGNGHINQTFLLRTDREDYILQRINKTVFKSPPALMENIVGVTEFLAGGIKSSGGDSERECMNVIPANGGESYHLDEDGEYWRCYLFVRDSLSFERIERPEDFYESGIAFGRFSTLLSDYPADTLHETIPDFHNTPKRFRDFIDSCGADIKGRAAACQEEISFIRQREDFTSVLTAQIETGALPLTVTHNDTKLNNVLFDRKTRKGLCVIDLDTIMPGLAAYDFGDSIRFGATTALEDERDLTKVHFDISLFEHYLKGYLTGTEGRLTQAELDALPYGAILMTLECGMRFLSDYLSGDVYFRIHRESHNLDRSRTQLRLVYEMEQQLDDMKKLVRKWGK